MTRPPASSIQAWVARRRKGLLAVILVGYSLITIGYGLLNPLFEAPDEQHHFFTILYVAENGRLPIATPSDEWLRQEAAQPPLTYVLAALLARGASSAQAQAQIWPNPHAILGDASAQTNINRFVHSADEAWPWQGYALTAHWLRLFSTLVGLGTLLFIYASGRLLWPQQPEIALLATGLVAFLPQYNFLHSAISNDDLAIFFCTAALWQLLRLWQTFSSWPRLLLLGITIGLTVLSKTVGLLLLVYALGVLFLLWIKNQPRIQHQSPHVNRGAPTLNLKGLLFQLLLVLIPALLLGGWLWWRNWQLYGDVTATAPFVQFAGGNRQATPLQVWGEWASLWPSLIAVFGWFNLRPPQWIYWMWVGLALTAVAGGLRGLSKRPLKRELHRQSLFALLTRRWFIAVLLFIWVILVYAGLFTFMLQTEAAQGRLLFPALLPIALGMAYGLSRWRWPGVGLLALLLALITTLYSLFFVIRPAYALPPAVPALPSAATRIGAEVGQGLWLEGVQVETAVAHPGDNIWLTLYWQASEPLQEPVEFVLEILGSDLVPVGRLQSFHGRGLYPANLWPPGQIIA
ncbi:MAG: glycosyltransferase family 39 protein, partial [Anaerolineales bacterium]|nr:glycosyltransferase family 39 protein [Anaerolineales bacterium]